MHCSGIADGVSFGDFGCLLEGLSTHWSGIKFLSFGSFGCLLD